MDNKKIEDLEELYLYSMNYYKATDNSAQEIIHDDDRPIRDEEPQICYLKIISYFKDEL
jgi:hypothetical protein